MKFWAVTVYNRAKKRDDCFLVESDNEPTRIIQILAEVHREYENIRIKSTKKPLGVKGYEAGR